MTRGEALAEIERLMVENEQLRRQNLLYRRALIMDAGHDTTECGGVRLCAKCRENAKDVPAEQMALSDVLPDHGEWLIFLEKCPFRIKNIIRNSCIEGFDELCAFSREDLLFEPNVGRVSVNALESYLAEFGRRLRKRGEGAPDDAVRCARLRNTVYDRQDRQRAELSAKTAAILASY
jgi:hypothetical protein